MTGTLDIQALVLHRAQDLRLEAREAPRPASDEVQVAVKATGLCGSDLHYYAHGRNGNFVVRAPLVLGHESSGVVTEVGPCSSLSNISAAANGIGTNSSTSAPSPSPSSSPTGLRVGDRVALEVGLPCRACALCLNGRYNLCPKLTFKSSAKTFPHADGTLQTRITHPASMCHSLPDNVTFEQGALVEPLAVSLHAINRSQTAGSGNTGAPLAGSTALVLGAGAVGILTAAALSVMGVTELVIADIDAARLKIAREMGNGRFGLKTHLLPRPGPKPSQPPTIEETLQDASKLALQITGTTSSSSTGFDRVFECTGIPSCVQLGIFSTVSGGKLILVGMGNPIQTLPLGAAALREVDIVGVFRYNALCYPAAINLFASGKLNGIAEALVTHRVKLEEGEKAFRLAANAARDGEDEGRVPVKVVVVS